MSEKGLFLDDLVGASLPQTLHLKGTLITMDILPFNCFIDSCLMARFSFSMRYGNIALKNFIGYRIIVKQNREI